MGSQETHRDLSAWSIESSTVVLNDRWIRVRSEACRSAEGVAVAPFYVLDYPDWVQIVALDEQEHVLLVRQYRHGLGVMSLELPAGSVDPADADPITAAKRELAEETGYTAVHWRHVGTLAPNPANQSNRCHIILSQGARSAAMPQDDPTERVQLLRVPVDEAVRLAQSGGIVQAMHVAALALALSALGRW